MENRITIAGKEYHLMLTVHGLDELMERMGRDVEITDLPNYIRGMDAEGKPNAKEAWGRVIVLLRIMLQSAEDYHRMEAKLLGREYAQQTIPSADELAVLLSPGALTETQILIMQTASASLRTTVRPDEKNGMSGETV